MFLENIIRPAEVLEFEKSLMPHQLARLPAAPKGISSFDDSDDDGEDIKMGGGGGEKVSERMGPETVLDRAVMEHNLLSCAKVGSLSSADTSSLPRSKRTQRWLLRLYYLLEQLYVNISFSGLGALLDLAPSGAETMARRMIEQERLRGWIE